MSETRHSAVSFEVASVNRQGADTTIDGILIDPETMRAYVADEAAARRSMEVGSPTDQVVIHLARGELSQAGEMIAEQRLLDPMNAHLRVLDTELTRMQGDLHRAINRLRKLAEEFAGTQYEPLMQQHLGMAFFETGDYRAAITRFSTALELRQAINAPRHLLDGSRICLEIAQERLRATA
ncbi:hypothetical protein OK351_04650 [Glutamicibacter sp. MNS18]|uniref:tetratricopeptide repeat protein n=1 Tax=Glutamicibacter sp. MNS18 TaxID=2989817 RepID=UPI00223650F8|nr:hypothetical protein [Glutamicibacter sp. MNS18]MCW4464795.1 hypothetical protein [Glutamicibacter sp. MNS18]